MAVESRFSTFLADFTLSSVSLPIQLSGIDKSVESIEDNFTRNRDVIKRTALEIKQSGVEFISVVYTKLLGKRKVIMCNSQFKTRIIFENDIIERSILL